jgi:hypothetical protein
MGQNTRRLRGRSADKVAQDSKSRKLTYTFEFSHSVVDAGGWTDIHSDECVHGPKLYWPDVSRLINFQRGDVLYIFEPISASQIALKNGPEMIAFANPGAASCRMDDFTEKLKELGGVPWAVSHIYADMHRDALEGKLGAPPIHVAHPTKPSIVLQRWEDPVMRQPLACWAMLRVELQDGEQYSYLGWREWLTEHIDGSGYNDSQIRVVAQYEGDSGSTLLNVAVPLHMWPLLGPNDGYARIDQRSH